LVKVFLVDDHAVVRRGLIDLLGGDPELNFVGEAGSVAEAMAMIPAVGPDVAVLDDWLPDGNGIELCRELLSCMPGLRCMILTSYTADEAMLDAVLAGGSGYVVKDMNGISLRHKRCGRRTVAARQARRGRTDGEAGASHRQQRRGTSVIGLAREGLTNKQIADRMLLAEESVKNQVSRLLVKLGVAR